MHSETIGCKSIVSNPEPLHVYTSSERLRLATLYCVVSRAEISSNRREGIFLPLRH